MTDVFSGDERLVFPLAIEKPKEDAIAIIMLYLSSNGCQSQPMGLFRPPHVCIRLRDNIEVQMRGLSVLPLLVQSSLKDSRHDAHHRAYR